MTHTELILSFQPKPTYLMIYGRHKMSIRSLTGVFSLFYCEFKFDNKWLCRDFRRMISRSSNVCQSYKQRNLFFIKEERSKIQLTVCCLEVLWEIESRIKRNRVDLGQIGWRDKNYSYLWILVWKWSLDNSELLVFDTGKISNTESTFFVITHPDPIGRVPEELSSFRTERWRFKKV